MSDNLYGGIHGIFSDASMYEMVDSMNFAAIRTHYAGDTCGGNPCYVNMGSLEAPSSSKNLTYYPQVPIYSENTPFSWMPVVFTYQWFMVPGTTAGGVMVNITNTGSTTFNLLFYAWMTLGMDTSQRTIYYNSTEKAFVVSNKNFSPSIPYLVVGSCLTPAVYDISGTGTNINGEIPTQTSPPIYQLSNSTGPSSGDLMITLAYNLTYGPHQTQSMPFLFAWSGLSGNLHTTFSVFNQWNNVAECMQAMKADKAAFASYINNHEILTIGNSTINAAEYWAKVALNQSQYLTQNYGRILYVLGWDGYWTRDTMWASLGALYAGDFEMVRRTIDSKLDAMDGYGGIPTLTFYTGGGGVDSIDANPLTVIAAYQYYTQSGNTTWLNLYGTIILKAANWIAQRYVPSLGLITEYYQGKWYSGWMDSALAKANPKPAEEIYENALAYEMSLDAAQIGLAVSNMTAYDTYTTLAAHLRNGINANLWSNAYGIYAPFIDTSGANPYPNYLQSDGNLLCIIYGIANYTQATDILYQVHQRDMVSSIPALTVSPAYPFCVGDYQNAAPWPWIGALLIAAERTVGQYQNSINDLYRMASALLDGPASYSELYGSTQNPTTGYQEPTGSWQFIWTAGMYLYAMNYYAGLVVTNDGILVNSLAATTPVTADFLRYHNLIMNITYTSNENYVILTSGTGTYTITLNFTTENKPTSAQIYMNGVLDTNYNIYSNCTVIIPDLDPGNITIHTW
jgi:hypothetical protein